MTKWALILLCAFPSGLRAQSLATPQYTLPGTDYKQEAPAINQMFRNDSLAVSKLQKQVSSLPTTPYAPATTTQQDYLCVSSDVVAITTFSYALSACALGTEVNASSITYEVEYNITPSLNASFVMTFNNGYPASANWNYGSEQMVAGSAWAADASGACYDITLNATTSEDVLANMALHGKTMFETASGNSLSINVDVQGGHKSSGSTGYAGMVGHGAATLGGALGGALASMQITTILSASKCTSFPTHPATFTGNIKIWRHGPQHL